MVRGLYSTRKGALGAIAEYVAPGHLTRTDEDGNVYVGGYYVIHKVSDEVDPLEREGFYDGSLRGAELDELVDRFGPGSECEPHGAE